MFRIINFVVINLLLMYSNLISDYYTSSCRVDPLEINDRWNDYRDNVGFLYQQELDLYGFNPADDELSNIGLTIHVILDPGEELADFQNKISTDTGYLQQIFLNHVGINFEVLQVNDIENTDDQYSLMTVQEQENLASAFNQPNTINIYYVPPLYEGAKGISTLSSAVMDWYNRWVDSDCRRYEQYILINKNSTDETVLSHEMGHHFDLFHTFEENLFGKEEEYPDSDLEDYERGDLIYDTPRSAVDKEHTAACSSGTGDDYKVALNLMTTRSPCRQEFTEYQVKRMRYTLFERRSNLILEWIRVTNDIDGSNPGGLFKIIQNQ